MIKFLILVEEGTALFPTKLNFCKYPLFLLLKKISTKIQEN